ncbi:hypothetical protein [Devosia naphthalenivorans]|uniref:hypothetical protein n=1 Tax=Devosia naphthalenivorans TaxID=2082392 RepID=UPI000D34A334|nr:hypothetical protein [Devosia naphthalenivorans]
MLRLNSTIEDASKDYVLVQAWKKASNYIRYPGGSLLEGMRLAKHFYEKGVGTVVRSGDLCASACALMFMMGRAVGSEVSFINRKLHVEGLLGFHRPSLRLPMEDEFGAGDLEATYDMAVTSVVDYIVLANKTAPWSNRPMVHSDLVERIFATPGDDMFYIDTVEKAARWDIELMGVRYSPTMIDEEHAYYACENALQWKVALHDEPLDYVGLNLSGHWTAAYSYQVPAQHGQRFSVTSRKAGYAAAGCLVDFTDQGVRICGEDEYTGIKIGNGSCPPDASEGFEWVDYLALWRPDTKLRDINTSWVSATKNGTCQVYSAAGTLTDNESCFVSVNFEYSGTQPTAVQTFTWPSGSRTQIRSFGINYRINDDAAQRKYLEGYAACFDNARTGNRFCFSGE